MESMRALAAVGDGDGVIEQPIPPGVTQAKLTLGEGDEEEVFTLQIGHVDPIDTDSGIQARLNNLGYPCGSVDGKL